MKDKEQIESDWDALYGDRKIELVFIGQHLNKEEMITELEGCLLTTQELQIWEKELFPKIDEWPILN